jgi:hypothetical protein
MNEDHSVSLQRHWVVFWRIHLGSAIAKKEAFGPCEELVFQLSMCGI